MRNNKGQFTKGKRTREIKDAISKALKGKPKSKEFIENLRKIRTGWKFSEETKRKISESNRGEKNYHWKGGRYFDSLNKYYYVIAKEHPNRRANGYILEHRFIVEKNIGRLLNKNEIIHHINLDTTDNRIENLYLYKSASEHKKVHYQLENLMIELFKKGIIRFNNGRYYYE